jgi:beta-phosphoglucomutase-like phosphatase (HAD superfamily)
MAAFVTRNTKIAPGAGTGQAKMPPELIIFDCDGVLIDSEDVAASVIARELTTLGWEMSVPHVQGLFLGMSITDMQPLIETRLGRRLPPSWRPELAEKLVLALGEDARLIAGARELLERVTELGIPWRIASNSSDQEMAVKFARTGLTGLVDGKTHSAASVIAKGGRPKPAPDVFLAAAAAEKIPPTSCVVLEDSAVGVTGAVAAGMRCFGFAPHGDGAHLRAAGATHILRDLHDLFGVLA